MASSRHSSTTLPAYDYLFECLDYYPTTGEFVWRVRPASHFPNTRICNLWNAKYAGKIAGSFADEYVRITLDQTPYKAHRIAYKMMTGRDPEFDIDHRNTNPHDNRWSNLRVATVSQNTQNKRTYKNNSSGVKGVSWDTNQGKWLAQINVHGKKHFLGRFDDIDLAAAEVSAARIRLHKEFARHA